MKILYIKSKKQPILQGENVQFRVGFVLDKKFHICYIIPRNPETLKSTSLVKTRQKPDKS